MDLPVSRPRIPGRALTRPASVPLVRLLSRLAVVALLASASACIFDESSTTYRNAGRRNTRAVAPDPEPVLDSGPVDIPDTSLPFEDTGADSGPVVLPDASGDG